jgi:hypothetical protein
MSKNVPASLPLIRTWEEGLVVHDEDDDRMYVEDLSGRRFLISKRAVKEEALRDGDAIMFVPGRTTALKVARP